MGDEEMSDLLIKNMELPKSCEGCFACHECSYDSYDYCNILKAPTTRGERRKDCPLVALPEHGDLKDYDSLGNKMADKMERRKRTWHPFYYEGFKEALKMLDSAPTIVEASNE